jgi:hypothetical protein
MEMMGDLSCEMFEHVLDSIETNARMTLPIVKGTEPLERWVRRYTCVPWWMAVFLARPPAVEERFVYVSEQFSKRTHIQRILAWKDLV